MITKNEDLIKIRRDLETEIQDIKSELSITGHSKSLDVIQREYQETERLSKQAREVNERAVTMFRNAQDEIRSRESSLQDLKHQLQVALNKFKEKEDLQAVLIETNAEIEQLKETIERTDEKYRVDLGINETKLRELNVMTQEIAREEQELIGKVQFIQTSVHRNNSSSQELRMYAI